MPSAAVRTYAHTGRARHPAVALRGMLLVVAYNGLLLPVLQPVVAGQTRVVPVDLPVAVLPLSIFGTADADPTLSIV